jgi:hypothetical protein
MEPPSYIHAEPEPCFPPLEHTAVSKLRAILSNMLPWDLPRDPDHDYHAGCGQEVLAHRAVHRQRGAHAERKVQQVRRRRRMRGDDERCAWGPGRSRARERETGLPADVTDEGVCRMSQRAE